MHKKKIRVLICDDHPGMLRVLSLHLQTQPEVQLLGACKTGQEAVEKSMKLVPDILFVDINMPPPDGFEVTRQLAKAGIKTRIIGFSILNNPQIAEKMIQAGASGYITKTSPPEEIMIAITTILAGEKYICQEIIKTGL